MKNNEVFERFGSHQWLIEHQLYFFLQQYWEENCQKYGTQLPTNPIGFIKNFMKQDTFCEDEISIVQKSNAYSKDIIDAEYEEIN